MRKIHVVFLALLALSVAPRPAAAADRLACQTAGIITKCPADAQLAAGSVLQGAFVPWSAAPAGSIPNSALVTTPPTLSSSTPSAIGTAAPGLGTAASRFDHVHALPSVGTAGTYVYPISITTDAQGRATGITAGSAPQAASADLTALSSFGSGLGIPVRTATTPTWSISTTLTGITISCASNTCSNIANSALVNSSVTVTAGTGLSGGGVVSLGGSVTVSLPSTGPGAGAIAYPASVTLDAQGRVTAATAGSAPALATRQVLAGSGLSGGGALTGDVTISMPVVGTAGTYGYPSSVTTDAQGRVSSITAGSAPAALASTTPADVGTAAVGVGTTAARSDHVHALPGGGTTLPKANGGFGQSVATGLTFGDGVYVDSSGVLQIGKVPFDFNLFFYGGTTTNEYALIQGNAVSPQLSAIGVPLFSATSAGTCFLLVAQSDTPSSGTVTYRIRKSTDKGGTWASLSPAVTCNYTNGTTTCTDSTNLGVIAAGDWIQPTVQWSVSSGLGYYGGVRFKCRYN